MLSDSKRVKSFRRHPDAIRNAFACRRKRKKQILFAGRSAFRLRLRVCPFLEYDSSRRVQCDIGADNTNGWNNHRRARIFDEGVRFLSPPSLAIREQEQRRRAAVYRRRCRTNVGRINNILYIGQLRRIDEFKVVRGRRSARFNIVSTSSATSVTSRRPKNIFFFFFTSDRGVPRRLTAECYSIIACRAVFDVVVAIGSGGKIFVSIDAGTRLLLLFYVSSCAFHIGDFRFQNRFSDYIIKLVFNNRSN